MERQALFSKHLSALLITIVVMFAVATLGGCSSREINHAGEVSQPSVAPSASLESPTKTTMPTLTSTPVPTYTRMPTITPIPRLWSAENYSAFWFGKYNLGFNLYISGWPLYAGAELLDDPPCLTDCNSVEEYNEAVGKIWKAFEANQNADFYCEWACEAVYNGFGSILASRVGDFSFFREVFGNKGTEPYCPQFDVGYESFSCNVPQTRDLVPNESLGWSESVRADIENKYLYPIIYGGWDRWPGMSQEGDNYPDWDWPSEWTREDIRALSDTYVCWIIANGHYYYGWPEIGGISTITNPSGDMSHFREERLKLREKLNNELGVSVGGIPPLCPGFLGMIEPPYLP